jgi:hypothetical protein
MSTVQPVQHPLSLLIKLKKGETPVSLVQNKAKFPDILHFAWTISLADKGLERTILLTTVYDGDFDVYLDKFIESNHEGFDLLLAMVEDGPPVPVADNRKAFHDWVRKNNINPLPVFFSAYPSMSVNDIQNC